MSDVPPFRVVISGPIAAGKTTLLRLLRRLVDCSTYEEPVVDNPYLEDMYADPHRWSFEMDAFMLNVRLQAQGELADVDHFIQDRCYLEDAIFAETRAKMGFVDQRSQVTYRDHLEMMTRVMNDFDLVIYLDISAEECMRRIKKRNRECEQGIRQEYLDELCCLYRSWVDDISKRVPVLFVRPERIYVENGTNGKLSRKASALWKRAIELLANNGPRVPRTLTPPPATPEAVPSVPTKIVIVGPIAAGKTTIAENWGKQTGYSVHKEPVSENEYLEDYYRDQERWAFETQIYILNKRLNAQLEADGMENTIQDRSYLDDEVFAAAQVARGYMSARALDNYLMYFLNMSKRMRKPHVILYVSVSPRESMKRIAERQRRCELTVKQEYLDALGKKYDEWAKRISKTVPVFRVEGTRMWTDERDEEKKRKEIERGTEILLEKVRELFERERPESGLWEVEI